MKGCIMPTPKHLLFLFFLCCFALALPLYAAGTVYADSTYLKVRGELVAMKADPDRAAVVQNLVIERETGKFILQSGTLYLCTPAANRVCAAYFVGTGRFEFSTPTAIETHQLQRFFHKESLSEEFSRLFIVFGDTTEQELKSKLKLNTALTTSKVDDAIANEIKFLTYGDDYYFNYEVMLTMLEGSLNELFYAHIGSNNTRDLFFSVDPTEAEEVQLARLANANINSKYNRELICQFHRKSEYATGINMAESKAPASIQHYDMDCSINTGLTFRGKVVLTLTPHPGSKRWLPFLLSGRLEVDSARWGDGTAIITADIGGRVWLQSPAPLNPGKTETLTLYYHGDIFDRMYDIVFMKTSSSGWYPRLDDYARSTYNMRFTVPKSYKFVSAGVMLNSEERDEQIISTWKVDYPTIHTSFVLGIYNEKKLEDPNLPPASLWYTNYATQQKSTAEDVRASLLFYQKSFGKPPFEKLVAAEIPYSHGQAFPGFLHLPWWLLRSGDNSGEDEAFTAHEAAHQWWGTALGWSNYHDQWMSEAFSEYSSLMYAQAVLKDNEKFFKILRKYKKKILERKESADKHGIGVGAIWLGARTATTESTEGDYNLFIYSKGAWVLHMLRNLMYDVRNNNDDKFLAMMKDFYTTYYGKDPTTQDFQAMVDKHNGQSMAWFFDQWIYGADIPTYKVAYKKTQTPEGKVKITMRVKQEGVSNDFIMLVPIFIEQGVQSRFIRRPIKGALTEIELPLLDSEPKKIHFNYLDSVLCDVEEEDWE